MTDATQDLNTNAAASVEGTTSSEPKVTLTAKQRAEAQIAKLTARIAKDQEELADLTARKDSLDKLDSITLGTNVTFNVGRQDNLKRVQGVVTAIDNSASNPRYKVFYGEGMTAETTIIWQSQVLDVVA